MASRRSAQLVLAGAVVVAGGALAIGWAVGRDDGTSADGAAGSATSAPNGVDDLVAERAGELAAADGRLDAVVSLRSYRSVSAVARVAERGGVPVLSLLVAVPGGEPGVVTDVGGVDPAEELVYGFTTEASAEVLRELALRADVRMVDVSGTLPIGLRPEEETTIGSPPTRPPRPD